MLNSTVKECCNCEGRTSLIFGNIDRCPKCGFSLAPDVIALNKTVTLLANQMLMLCELAKEETGKPRQALINSAIETAEKLNNLLKVK